MPYVINALKDTISITQFNRGMAGKIFADVKANGAKVVIKNNHPEAVLLSPDEYLEMMEIINDYRLSVLAMERLGHYDAKVLLSEDEMDRRLGINPADLENFDDVDLE